jgi:Protein of unknown function (DUF2934)
MAATPRQEEIARRAQALWEQEGRPDGRDVEFWLRAERELDDAAIEPLASLPGDEDTAHPA